mmetsp:Transcript_10386/g.24952  ORF Transcript_10386/g.24952 Transcript_10386/m.24952 type:complete len:246 (-) Transcript_10386:513-1250(-)|eukprot:CAMPEP_0168744432 /NCGR_PEP_ID=MMETSP0724-20121128/14090_1 /TAXON_ID=265536 /ORGANISM="Amphiprora sp., Strain CCMP467" /LENGTH=245 /DNA_ID=CAMNT_0008792095 /DNA_START=1169 /DNA_END=1906 /DNA_ORIENTATION=-
MLAPRKTLWSTPRPVLDHVIGLVSPLQPNDVVCDIGCGDGRCILEWATAYSRELLLSKEPSSSGSSANRDDIVDSTESPTTAGFVGLDIDPHRIQHATDALTRARREGTIPASLDVQFHCANALERPDLFRERATIVFLYLIPRGLQLIRPLLMLVGTTKEGEDDDCRETDPDDDQIDDDGNAPIPIASRTIISYMAPLPDMPEGTLVRRDKITVQTDTAWPVYVYRVSRTTTTTTRMEKQQQQH